VERRQLGGGRRAIRGLSSPPTNVDCRLVSALAAQLEQRDAALRAGAGCVGWKLGMGERERIGGEIADLTSATLLAPGGSYRHRGDVAELRADAELAVEVVRAVEATDDPRAIAQAIGAYVPALEIVDLTRLADEPVSVVAANVFHRGVAFGPATPKPRGDVHGSVVVNGNVEASGAGPEDLVDRIAAAARILAAVGERIEAGDRLLTGSIVQVPVTPGDELTADLVTSAPSASRSSRDAAGGIKGRTCARS
jgi:2-keto-4-pentenoate hydratase